MSNPTRRQILSVAAVAGTAGLTGYITGVQDDEEMVPEEDGEFNTVDVMFVRMMIPHHEGAIQMAELIPGRTDRAELLDLRTEIIETQEAEIEEMCELLEDAGVAGCEEVGGMMPHEMGGMGHRMGEEMENGRMIHDEMAEMMPDREHMRTHAEKQELRRAEDQTFDCLFAEQMARHHEGAVMMAEHVLDEGDSERVATLAEEIMETQEEEIEQLDEWQDDWDC